MAKVSKLELVKVTCLKCRGAGYYFVAIPGTYNGKLVHASQRVECDCKKKEAPK